jgi:hypothetical protein
MRRNLLGPEHIWVAAAQEDLAWVLHALDRFEEAQFFETDALVTRISVPGSAK